MLVALEFALDAGPSDWATAQRGGDPAVLREAVNRTLDLARIADESGVESLWCIEDPDGWDAFAVLGAMARETTRLRVGTGVTNPYYRHPALLAASTSTLDLLSDGRAFLGFGRGQAEWYREALGIPVGKPVRALGESFDLLGQWWSSDMRATSGADDTEFQVRDWERTIRPLANRVPIYLAAVGPLALKLAGRLADGVIFNDLASIEYMEGAIATVKETARTAGRDSNNLRFYARSSITITDDLETLLDRRKATVATIHALPGMELLLTSSGHDTEKVISDVRAAMNTNAVLQAGGGFGDLRRAGDMTAAKAAIPNDLMAELVVAGDLQTVRKQLARLEAIGVTHVFLARPDVEATAASLRQLMADLLP